MPYQTVNAIWDNEAQGWYCPDCYHPMEMKDIEVWVVPTEVWQCDYCETEFTQPVKAK
jgi:ribosomal protein L37AE/L43A